MAQTIPEPLLDDIADGKCLPFVGAGFSLNARLPRGLHMPDWRGLAETLAKTAAVSADLAGPSVCSTFEKRFGRVQLIEAIRKALHVDNAEPGDAQKAFANLPFDTIYTTNFDLLLEEAYGLVHKPFRSLVGELQMPFHGGLLTTNIVKMHGDLRHEEHIIVTQEDYERYLTDYPVIATHLSAMLITRTALFVGYSLSDPDFQHIKEVVRSRLGKFERMAYIVQFDALPADAEAMLSQNLHVISVAADSPSSRDAALAELFLSIQESLDAREGARFRAATPEVFEPIREETFEKTSRAVDASPLLTSSSNLCFVLMPFRPETDAVYRVLIRPAAEQFGLAVLRADEIYAPGAIMEQIRTAIQQARLCVADVSGQNPNVLYELGVAQTVGKPTVLLSKEIGDVPFDLRSMRLVQYNPDSIEAARPALESAIQHVLGEDRLDEARRLIENGMYRAAAAMLGVLLEHGLRQLAADRLELPRLPIPLERILTLLADSEIVEREDISRLWTCAEIRNRAVHGLEEPTADDVRIMLGAATNFIDKYLGREFLKGG